MSPAPKTVKLNALFVAQQSVHADLLHGSHVNLPVGNRWHGELHSSAGIVTLEVLSGVVKLVGQVGRVYGVQRSGSVSIVVALDDPRDSVSCAIGRDGRRW